MWLPTLFAEPDIFPWETPVAERRRGRREQEETPPRYDRAGIGSVVSYHRGTQLEGTGSASRFRAISAAVEMGVDRYEEHGFGVQFGLSIFPPPNGGAQRGFFFRSELLAGLGVATWEGQLPGSVVLGLGLGGDYLDIWADEPGRFYGIGRARLSLWLRRDVTLGLAVETLPLVASPVAVSQHEHRFALSTSYGLVELGARAGFTFLDGGEPSRSFAQQTVGGFVGVVVR